MEEIKDIVQTDMDSELTFWGRKVMIQSDGTGRGTEIYIDGKQMKYCTNLEISIRAGEINKIRLSILDFGE